MGAGIERHADPAAGELLRRVDRRVRPHHDRPIGDDAAAADLTAADTSGAGAAVVAPFAGVVHVGFAGFEQRAVADELVGGLHVRDRGVCDLDAGLVALGPLDLEPFFGEQPFVMSHQFRQALERRGGLENEFLHGAYLRGCSMGALGRRNRLLFLSPAQNIVETSEYRFYAHLTICQRRIPTPKGRVPMNLAHALLAAAEEAPPGSQIEGAYRRLRDDIISGVLVPSQKLRIEHLRKSCGFGASALREALSRLVSDGLVECEAQRGYWVSPVSRAAPR